MIKKNTKIQAGQNVVVVENKKTKINAKTERLRFRNQPLYRSNIIINLIYIAKRHGS